MSKVLYGPARLLGSRDSVPAKEQRKRPVVHMHVDVDVDVASCRDDDGPIAKPSGNPTYAWVQVGQQVQAAFANEVVEQLAMEGLRCGLNARLSHKR
jgi:hypothetical protein